MQDIPADRPRKTQILHWKLGVALGALSTDPWKPRRGTLRACPPNRQRCVMLCRGYGVVTEHRSARILRIRKLRISVSKYYEKSPMDLGVPPPKIKNLLESNPLKLETLSPRIDRRDGGLALVLAAAQHEAQQKLHRTPLARAIS